jgi:hypothetical protein
LKIALCFVFLIILLSGFAFVSEVQAIIPQMQDVSVTNSGDDTILDVTFFHTPVMPGHRVNFVEVDIDGIISNYQISQDSLTFTAQINLGQITGNPTVRARVQCIVDGWSSWSEQLSIPEFPSWIILPMIFTVTLFSIIFKRKLHNINVS